MNKETFSQKVTIISIALAALGALAAVITFASLGKTIPPVLLTVLPLVVGVLVPSPGGHSALFKALDQLTQGLSSPAVAVTGPDTTVNAPTTPAMDVTGAADPYPADPYPGDTTTS